MSDPDSQNGLSVSRRSFLKSFSASAAVAATTQLESVAQELAQANVEKVRGPEAVAITLQVNGQTRKLEVEPRVTLLEALRDRLGLTGPKEVCDRASCGACTVLFDGVAVRSCLMFAVQAQGSAITTIEGVTPGPGELSPVQDAFCETHGTQCGFCTPAMILTAHALLADNPNPTRAEIVEAISGNICRCTGYAQIVEAIALAAERMRGANRPKDARP
jgi:carbon-monoxide dehydrogenase small subunit